jgi:uncharacterized membrane protein
MKNEKGWVSNNLLVTVLLVLGILVAIVLLIMFVDVNVKG